MRSASWTGKDVSMTFTGRIALNVIRANACVAKAKEDYMNHQITVIEYFDKGSETEEKYVRLDEYATLAEYTAKLEGTLRMIADLKHHEVVSGHSSWQQLARDVLKDVFAQQAGAKE
jgi:hypothetical protein